MRRTATAALTAALMLTGTSAARAQPGPPSDIPAPPSQAQGSPDTGQERSAEARENAAPQGSPATGVERSAEARDRGETDTDEATDVPVDAEDVDVDELLDSDAGDVDVELPEQADQARGVRGSIAAAFTAVLDTIKSLFGYHVRRLLDAVNSVVVDAGIGYAAGALRQDVIRAGVEPAPSGVDAIVAAEVDARAAHGDAFGSSRATVRLAAGGLVRLEQPHGVALGVAHVGGVADAGDWLLASQLLGPRGLRPGQ